MRRSRALILSLMITGGAVVALTGCSGKPENSPVIRKKFAEYDKAVESNTALTADVTRLNEEVARLSQENSELRALVPSVDGESVITKLSTLEARLAKVEGVAGDRALARATSNSQTSTTTTPAPAAASTSTQTLDQAPLAVAPAKVETEKKTVAVQQQSTPSRPAGFKEMTNPSTRTSTPVAKTSTTAETKKPEATKAAAPARRGTYHTFAAGETIDQVAAKYGVSAGDILKANRLPAGARVGTGQRLYVPGSK
ncbi:LysM peptidoglycan-binding domain-containing protein [bacterium]|nr:LysM peptidoglycan-binding domain-containing protein [bacterium]